MQTSIQQEMIMENYIRNLAQMQKSALENSMNVLSAMQEMTEQTIITACDNTPWLPDQARAMVGQVVGIMQTNRASMKELMTKSFDQMTDAITNQTKKIG